MTIPVQARELARFQTDGRGKQTIYRSSGLLVGVDAFEPGQSHAAHVHDGQEKVWMVLAGCGSVEVGGDRRPIETGELVVVPAGVAHGLHADRGSRLVALVVLAPGPTTKPAAGAT